MIKRPLAIDLFSGCGGMSLGLEAAGFAIAAAVEIDPIHSLVHHFNFPYAVTFCRDIAQVSSQEILKQIKKRGFDQEIDLIAGGPPCQGFSYMGKRQLDDPRNQLVFQYLRIIREIQPKYFLFENVPGIATGKHQQFLAELIEEFAQNGYNIVTPIQVLDASLYGAPQKRKRLILMGYRQDIVAPNYPNPIQSQSNLTTVATALQDLATIPAFVEKDKGIKIDQLDYSGFRQIYSPQLKEAFNLCYLRRNYSKIWGHLGSNHTETSMARFVNTTPGTIEKVSRFFKLDADGLANTLRAGTASDRGAYTAPRPIHYQHPRCITIREAARLHTFPDWFQFHRTIWHGFREIGNAVIPLLAKALGDEIIKCLDINTSELEVKKLGYVNKKILSYNMAEASKFWNVSNNVIPKRQKLK